MNRKIFLMMLAAISAGCGPYLSLVSAAPPNRVARVYFDAKKIEVTEGVAVALDCTHGASACREVQAVSSNPQVAQVFRAHLGKVEYGVYEQSNVSTVAIVGMAPGATTVRVTSESSSSDYEVVVLPAPQSSVRAAK